MPAAASQAEEPQTQTAEDANSDPVIDESVLCAAIGCDIGDRGEFVMRVLSLFEEHGPPALLKLAETAQSESTAEIADATHALKSMARNIGAIRLAAACQTLEKEAKEGAIENLTVQLSGLQKSLVEVLDAIGDMRAEAEEEPGDMAAAG
jgi:HPt (histidine-containing phosphotransfer) domain-containing protein